MGSISQVSLSVVRGPSHPLPKVRLLSRMFEDNARAHPAATAIIYKGIDGAVHKLSYVELDRAANCLARAIVSRVRSGGDHSDHVVAVSLPPSDALLLTLLAIWKAGAAYLPLDQQASNRVQHILSEAGPQLVITEEPEEKWDPALHGHNTVSFTTLDAEATTLADTALSDGELLPSAATPQPLALVLYTSGSTGVPKGVRLPHAVVLNRLRWQWREFPYSATERVCVFKTTLTFVDAVCEIWGPLLHGTPLALLVVPRDVTKDPQRLIPLLQEYKVERLLVVPTLLRAILLYLGLDKTHKLENLKTWVCSGEPLAVSLAQQFLDHFSSGDVALCNFYGSTEVMGDVTFHVIRTPEDLAAFDKVPIGRPVDNTAIYLLDKQLSVVPEGEVGEIYVAGLNVCAGYVNNRDPHKFLTNHHTVDPDMSRLYHTGDYGRLMKGTVLYEGRTDSQVKVRGHRVDLAEIDAALSKLPQVDKAAVLCYRPGEVDQMVIAYVTLHPDQECSGEDIERTLQSHLAIYAIPQVLITDSIPLLNNGKVDRQTLFKRYAEIGGSTNGEVAMIDPDLSGVDSADVAAAKCLLHTVAAVLGKAARGLVSLDANFYHLGGNSLNSVFTVTKLRDQGYLIGITDFIAANTLRDILEKMEPEDNIKDNDLLAREIPKSYISEIINNKQKSDVYRIIIDSFYSKGSLDNCIHPRIPRKDYHEVLDKIWEPLVKAELSFVLRSRATGQVVSVSLCYDAHDEPPLQLSGSGLNIIYEFLESLEAPIRDTQLPGGKGQVLYAYMMGTDQTLSTAENVLAIHAMEEEVLAIAQSRGFAGIFTTNTSPLTKVWEETLVKKMTDNAEEEKRIATEKGNIFNGKPYITVIGDGGWGKRSYGHGMNSSSGVQLGTYVFNYKVMSEFQANKYVAPDGSRPFSRAPDDLIVHFSWKEI